MSLILIFDLDDTLYAERTYVEGGFRAVAEMGAEAFGWDADRSLRFMIDEERRSGRGAVFDRWLDSGGRLSKANVKRAVSRYRAHSPALALTPDARALLPELSTRYPLYLITDGNKQVQHRKVQALGIERYFRKVYLTHRHGVASAKPSLHCFGLIHQRERCEWREMVYVGDNPAKDFVALNAKGGQTVRVLTGAHRDVEARPGHDAQHRIARLGELADLLPELEARAGLRTRTGA